SAVAFNGVATANFTVNSPTQITVIVPGAALTGVIGVSTPGGTAVSSGTFMVSPSVPPTIFFFVPDSGPIGSQVIIAANNFTGASSVAFNGVATANFTVNSPTQITATVPSGAVTGPIGVSTPGGTATSTANFNVTAPPAPTIASFMPTSGPLGTQVTITGT